MNQRTLGWGLLVIGVILLFVSLTADLLGVGRGPGFGRWQWGGTILGIILVVLGGFLRQRSPSS
jgi:hypothetical protein